MGDTISSRIGVTVTLGSTAYPSPLTVTNIGYVTPINPNEMNPTYDGTAGLNGVFVPAGASAASLVNFGEISGSVGDYSGNGGIGVDIASAATLQNSGLIQGGLGEFASDGFPAGNGGTGVSLAPSATLTNFGRIIAGQGGGSFEGEPGAGGVGAHLGAGAVAFNYGYISGGRGGAFMTSNLFDQFGIGGSGVYIGQTATLTNEAGGLIQGGGQGAGAVQLAANATLNNAGTIFGGAGNYNIGVAAVTGDIITNTGTISGGTGPADDFFGGPSPPGGTGVMLAGGSASNSGSIFGGAAGLYGPGAGGEGIYLGAGAIFTNSGLVTGGSGGNGEVIADLSDEYDYAGNGGAGVYLDGGMLITSGTIAGGSGGNWQNLPGNQGATLNDNDEGVGTNGDAVQFGARAGTLVVQAGAVFGGDIIANANVADELVLVGSSSVALDGFGREILNISEISFASASWGIEGNVDGLARGQTIAGFAAGDAIILDGFSAASETYVSGVGLELSNSTGTITIDLTGIADPGALTIDGRLNGTTITAGPNPIAPISSTISTSVASTVTLGSSDYASPLTITNTGLVMPGSIGAAGVFIPGYIPSGTVANYGAITGANGGLIENSGFQISYAGGAGVNDTAAAVIINHGTILGGGGGGGTQDADFEAGSGGGSGIQLASNGTFINFGTVSGGIGGFLGGPGGYGGDFGTGAQVTNFGTILGGGGGAEGPPTRGAEGVRLLTAATLNNFGLVAGGGGGNYADPTGSTGGIGAELDPGAVLTNEGTILGGAGGNEVYDNGTGGNGGTGVYIDGGTLINSGTIAGAAGGTGATPGTPGDAVVFGNQGGTLVVDPNAVFFGNVTAADSTDVLELAGTSAAALTGIGTSFTNFNSIAFASGAAWTIAGSAAALASGETIAGFGHGDTIILDGFAGASDIFANGALTLTNGATTDELDLGAGFTTGDFAVTTDGNNSTISLITGQLVTSGTSATFASGSLVSDPVVESGGAASVASGGTVSNPVIAGGTLALETGGTIIGAIDMTGDTGRLIISGASTPPNIISGFVPGDSIELASVPYVQGDTVVVNTPGVVTIETPDADYNLNIAGAYVGETGFSIAGDLVLELALCYLHGTLIQTPAGEVPVESLAIGDLVVTRLGGVQPIKWLGRQQYESRLIHKNLAKIPVWISAGALGRGLPRRDLCVSPGHSILLGNTLVLASALINGITIKQDMPDGLVAYTNIELDGHDCVLAEGCWAESFADGPGLRGQFDNAAEYHELYPDDAPPAALQLCAPRPEAGPALDAALRPVAARAAALVNRGKVEGFIDFAEPDRIEGWAHDPANPDLPVLLEIRLGDALLATLLACDFRADLTKAGMGRGRCAFFFKPFHPLEAAALLDLRIRCAATGEELAMTAECQAVIDKFLALAA